MKTVKSKLSINRGNKRLWLEGKYLKAHGWNRGDKFTVAYKEGRMVLKLDPEGLNTVSGRKRAGATEWTPIIDVCSADIAETFPNASYVSAKIEAGKITIKAFEG